MVNNKYDIIVIGAGHAGSEAAAAAANLGSSVLLITSDMTKIAQMSCNPAMGGIAKGQILREIDALGGYSGIVADKTSIQFRMLNKSKGPAMWSPRVQSDRVKFSVEWRKVLEENENISFWQDLAVDLIIENKTVKGVVTKLGVKFYADSVILTNGTFLNGLMYIGQVSIPGGRSADEASYGLSEAIDKFEIPVLKMKTGTSARLDGRTIDFSKLTEQKGDVEQGQFSYLPDINPELKQRSCYITYTNKEVHSILEKSFEFSPLFNGTIAGIGPRYCPSIEDKLVTFAGRDSHLMFLEPEGEDTVEYYINGFSSSLPLEAQYEALQRMEGLENVKIFRPGYAIEYDYFDPTFLYKTLESKKIANLYFAGQINGTTGYEEAAAQGLMAGINAHLKNNNKEPFVLLRNQAYIGVLIDDLVNKGVDEPYRMFTSRAEFRILLRQDNADIRLTEMSYKIGLATEERYNLMIFKKNKIDEIIHFFNTYSVSPDEINPLLNKLKSKLLTQKVKLKGLILRPEVDIFSLTKEINSLNDLIPNDNIRRNEIFKAAEILMKYDSYIQREFQTSEKIMRLEHVHIHDDFNFDKLESLSTEARIKLNKIRPKSIGEASRIPGVSPSDINVLLVYLGR